MAESLINVKEIQGVFWLLPVLERPENQRSIQRLSIDAAVGRTALTAALPARGRALWQRQTSLAAVKTDGLAPRQPVLPES